jgi:hypothetical protein
VLRDATIATGVLIAIGAAMAWLYDPPTAAGQRMSAGDVALLGATWPLFFLLSLGVRRLRDARRAAGRVPRSEP